MPNFLLHTSTENSDLWFYLAVPLSGLVISITAGWVFSVKTDNRLIDALKFRGVSVRDLFKRIGRITPRGQPNLIGEGFLCSVCTGWYPAAAFVIWADTQYSSNVDTWQQYLTIVVTHLLTVPTLHRLYLRLLRLIDRLASDGSEVREVQA